jgi:hypothetical protein
VSDPRVDKLTYQFAFEEGHDFSAAPPLDVRLADFECRLETGELVARPTLDYARTADAREVLEPYLSAWEASAEINGVHVEFRLSGAEVVDRDPDSRVVPLSTVMGFGLGSLRANLTIGHSAFPEPASSYFNETDTVTALRKRLDDHRRGRERLLSTANWVLTKLEAEHGGRKDAASNLNVDPSVLSKVGHLASYNDPNQGRKAKGPEKRLSGEEVSWLSTVLPLLVVREAERAGGHPSLARLTMADLPDLP